MRVLHVTSVLDGVGGVQRHVLASCRALAARGHDVELLALGTPPEVEVAGDLPVRWVPLDRKLLGRYAVPSSSAQLRRELRSFPGVVHAHQPFATTTLLAALAARHGVLTPYLHAPAFHGRGGRRRALQLRAVCSRFDAIAYISDAERAVGDALVGRRSRARSHVARPGIDVAAPPSAAPDRRIVAVVGALVAHKRPDLALRAAAEAGCGDDCRIVGRGPMEAALRELCGQLGLDDRQVVLGALGDQELADLLWASKVLVAPSTEESFGLALLDGIASGAVPVAADLPSHREILDITGCEPRHLVPVAAGVDVLAAAIGTAVAGPDVHLAVPPPTWDDTAAGLEAVYEAVLGGRARAAGVAA